MVFFLVIGGDLFNLEHLIVDLVPAEQALHFPFLG